MLINMNEVVELIEMDRATIRSKMHDGLFPKFKTRIENSQMWCLQEVKDWLEVFEWRVLDLKRKNTAWQIGRALKTSPDRVQVTIDKFKSDEEIAKPVYISSFAQVLNVSANLTNNREI